jgi:hypothetical protein
MVTLAGINPAMAGALTVKCSDQQSGQVISFAYDGDEAGVLNVVAPFGAMALPATSKEATNTVDNQTLAIRAINASGEASLKMPEQAALEQCIVKRRIAGEPVDKDIDFMSAMACQTELPDAEVPIAVTVDVEFALIDGQVQELVMHRNYPGTSEVTGAPLQLVTMAFGTMRCDAVK